MPEPIVVVARIAARPDAATAAEAALRRLVDAVAEEDGTVEYVLHREGESGSFWFYERYADQGAFDAHGENPALHQAFGALTGLLAEPPELHFLTPLQAKPPSG
jgi:quinol monooxygenase YgiN